MSQKDRDEFLLEMQSPAGTPRDTMKEFFAPAKRPSALRDIEEEDDIGDEFIEERQGNCSYMF